MLSLAITLDFTVDPKSLLGFKKRGGFLYLRADLTARNESFMKSP